VNNVFFSLFKVLYKRVVSGEITPNKLVSMSPEQLATPELAAWRQNESKHVSYFLFMLIFLKSSSQTGILEGFMWLDLVISGFMLKDASIVKHFGTIFTVIYNTNYTLNALLAIQTIYLLVHTQGFDIILKRAILKIILIVFSFYGHNLLPPGFLVS